MTPVALQIPQQHQTESFLTDPKQVSKWLDGLPMANLSDSARQIFKALIELNRLQMALSERKKLVDLLSEPVRFIIAGLKRRFIGVAFPLSEKNRKIAQLITEFDLQMAIAHKIMVQEILRGKPNKKLLSIVIYQALHHLTQALLHTSEVYATAPPKVWLDLHGLYRIAEQQQCLATKPAGQPLSIEARYQQTLLFAIVVRDRLPQQDIKPVLELLTELTPYSRLYPYHAKVDYERTLFLITQNQDHGPQHLLFADPGAVQDCRVLDVQDALAEVMARLARQDTESQSAHATKQLQWLKQAWQPARPHQSPRVSRERILLAALGLNAIHDLLQAQYDSADHQLLAQEPEVVQDPESLVFSSLNQVTLSLTPQEQRMTGGSDASTWGRTASSYLDEEAPLNIWAQGALHTELEQYQCCSLNESSNGYCLQWPAEFPEKLQIGLLMGLHSVERNHDQPEIGIIRWIHGAPNGTIQVGIEKLAADATAVLSRVKPPAQPKSAKAQEPAPFTKAILLPEQAEPARPPILITPALPYQVGCEVEIKENGHIRPVQLSHQFGHNALFSCFGFTEILVTNQDIFNQINQDMIANDYEVIWSQI